MTPPQVLTSVALVVPPHRQDDVIPAYRDLTAQGARPDGLLRSELLRGQGGRWLIQSLWRDLDAIVAARDSGAPPAALVLANQLEAQHSHEALKVEATLGG